MARPSLLFITPYFPAAEQSGSPRRAYAIASALGRTFDVTLLTLSAQPRDVASLQPLPAGCVANHFLPALDQTNPRLRWRRWFAQNHPRLFSFLTGDPLDWDIHPHSRRVDAARVFGTRRFDVIHAYRMVSAPYAVAIAEAFSASPAMHLDVDDIESITRTRLADLAHATQANRAARHERLNARAYARREKQLFSRFERLYVCSREDARRLASAHREVRVLPNTVAVPVAQPVPASVGELHRILFIGGLDYPPNGDALRWFCRDIFPQIRASQKCELIVAGRRAPAALSEFLHQQPGVVFVGEVPRSESVYKNAHLVIAPIRAGGGTRLKILEAFAQSRPVVTTTLGIEGIDSHPGEDHLRADTADDFAQACVRLIANPTLRAELSRRAFELVSRSYTSAVLALPLSNQHP